jgi:hypothetical protein
VEHCAQRLYGELLFARYTSSKLRGTPMKPDQSAKQPAFLFLPHIRRVDASTPHNSDWLSQSKPRQLVQCNETGVFRPRCGGDSVCLESFPPDVLAIAAPGDACSIANPLSLLPKTNLNPHPSEVASEQPKSIPIFR